jgi:hypothetical protein
MPQFSRYVSDMDDLFDELVAARGDSASLAAEIATKQDAAALPAAVFGQGTNIESVDLDDYKSDHIGRYYTGNATQSDTLTNCPYKSAAGNLTVEEIATGSGTGEHYVLQTWEVNGADYQYQKFTRKWRGSSNGWTPWYRIPVAFDDLMQPATALVGTSAVHLDLDDYRGNAYVGTYRCTTSNSSLVDHHPRQGYSFIMTVRGLFNSSSFQQEVRYTDEPGNIYLRNYTSSNWSSWYKIQGTALT